MMMPHLLNNLRGKQLGLYLSKYLMGLGLKKGALSRICSFLGLIILAPISWYLMDYISGYQSHYRSPSKAFSGFSTTESRDLCVLFTTRRVSAHCGHSK